MTSRVEADWVHVKKGTTHPLSKQETSQTITQNSTDSNNNNDPNDSKTSETPLKNKKASKTVTNEKPENTENTIKCSDCHQTITSNDWTNENIDPSQYGSGMKHKKCRIAHQSSMLWKQALISKQSQYSHSSAGSCTINALETAIRLQLNEQPTVQLIDNILLMASLYTSNMHTGVMEILPYVRRYSHHLESKHWMQTSVQKIATVVGKLDELLVQSKHSMSVCITKPPETIFIHRTSDEYILYDSHPRHERFLSGSHFLIFESKESIVQYLKLLFPFINLGYGFGLHGDMLNMCDAHFLQLKKEYWNIDGKENGKLKEILNPDLSEMAQDLGKIGFHLEMQFENNFGSSKNNNS